MSNSNFFIFPRLTELTERLAGVEAVRQRATECATGHVLELSARSHNNLFYYPRTITSLTALVSGRALGAAPRQHARQVLFPVDIREGSCDQIPLKDHRFDCVVSTFALGTAPNVDLALQEIKRVLKPAGRLLFAEFGLSRDRKVATWQRRFGWLNRAFHGVALPMAIFEDALASNGFSLRSSACKYLQYVPRALGCYYEGVASNEE
ncbi:MAG: class I SAM-dependent methyltransferase [Gammaproteobacteria bacterium]|nr:class I SAM-dependent methyltransferase [Gammaproteobacteria bacterium]